MRILFFLAYSDSIGGAAKQMIIHADLMKSRGHDVIVIIHDDICGKHIKEYDTIFEKLSLKYAACRFSIVTCIENIDLSASAHNEMKIRDIVEEYAPDIIHSLQINISVEKVARQLGIPHVVSIYQMTEGMFNLQWEDILFKYHCCDSDYYCQKWAKGLGIKSECIRVIYKPVDVLNKDVKEKSDCFSIINIGIFDSRKRQLEILKFICGCRDKQIPIHMFFVGKNDTPYGDKCRLFCIQHSLNDLVDFVGEVLDVENYLSLADIMVHASTSESYPGVIVEAMANRIPVICTPIAGIPELVEDEVNGILTKGYGAEDLYEAFLRYLHIRNEGQIDTLKEKAYGTYLNNHTSESAGEKLEAYYSYIMDDYQKRDHSHDNAIFEKAECNVKQFYECHNFSDCSEFTKRHVWYLYHINKACENYKTAAVWGTGNLGPYGAEWCKILGLTIETYIDTHREGEYLGYKLSKPDDEILKSVDVVFVSIGNPDALMEIMPQLEKLGRKRNVDYFIIENNPCL